MQGLADGYFVLPYTIGDYLADDIRTGRISTDTEEFEKAEKEVKERVQKLFDAKEGTAESDEADVLAILIDEYENTHYPIDAPDPIEAIKIRMEEMELKQKDLVGLIGGKSRVSEVLNKKKKLTIEMVRKLHKRLNISVNLLINDYRLLK
jgi:HTH-type transcriptional regulator/antitoxin HigA